MATSTGGMIQRTVCVSIIDYSSVRSARNQLPIPWRVRAPKVHQTNMPALVSAVPRNNILAVGVRIPRATMATAVPFAKLASSLTRSFHTTITRHNKGNPARRPERYIASDLSLEIRLRELRAWAARTCPMLACAQDSDRRRRGGAVNRGETKVEEPPRCKTPRCPAETGCCW